MTWRTVKGALSEMLILRLQTIPTIFTVSSWHLVFAVLLMFFPVHSLSPAVYCCPGFLNICFSLAHSSAKTKPDR